MTAIASLGARALALLGEDRVRYAAVSAIACAIDVCITLSLAWSHFAPALSAAAGYSIGLGVHWSLSRRFVFAAELAADHVLLRRQGALFVLSGLGGLGVTVAIFTSSIALGANALAAKALSVGVSFWAVYLIRRYIVFPQRA